MTRSLSGPLSSAACPLFKREQWAAITTPRDSLRGSPAQASSTGFSFGATDEFGYQAIENVVDVHDFHATILHLLGLDHERLTYNHNGTSRRLTDVHGHVIRGVLS